MQDFPSLVHRNENRNGQLRCKVCHTCSICQQSKPAQALTPSKAMCKVCEGKEIICPGCMKKLLPTSFKREAIRNFERKITTRPPVCHDCTARMPRIQKGMNARDAYKCTCPYTHKRRHHDASNEKCGLYPRKLGERRWPGKNTGVSEEDHQLWLRLQEWKNNEKWTCNVP